MKKYIREPMNGFTHLIGAIFAVVGFVLLIMKTIKIGAPALSLVAVVVFGLSMILLYSASAVYHITVAGKKVLRWLQKIDHSMIFLLIAGTYTPYCLITLQGSTGWVLFSITMAIAVFGICFKLIWFRAPRWISTGLYLAMGWLIIFVFSPLVSNLNVNGLLLLGLGGISYTIGGIIYGFKPKWIEIKYFGFHEIFHLFVMVGTSLHFLSIYMYVI